MAAAVEGVANARILDIGCGTGDYTKPLAAATEATVHAIDVTAALLRLGREDASANLHYSAADAMRLPFPDGSFDALVGNAVLHHLPLDHALPELIRVAKPGARLCFAEPNLLNPHVFLERNVPFLRRWFENSPDEIAFVRWRLRPVLERFGLVDVRIEPFDFLYPATPSALIHLVEVTGRVLEHLPGVREIAGSLLICARTPIAEAR